MGFGLIFLGWTMLFFFKVIPVGILGCIFMAKGLEKLDDYNDYFLKAKQVCYGFLLYFITFGVLWILDMINVFKWIPSPNESVGSIGNVVYYCDSVVYYAILVVFCYFLYKGLGEISKLVGFDKGVTKEKRAAALMIVFLLFTAIRLLLVPFGLSQYLTLSLVVFEFVWLFYSAGFIYSCYMMIATQQIIDDENKKMREYDEKHSFRTLKKKK